jgi:hypothetical protein
MTSNGVTGVPTDLPGLGDEFLSQRNRSFPGGDHSASGSSGNAVGRSAAVAIKPSAEADLVLGVGRVAQGL